MKRLATFSIISILLISTVPLNAFAFSNGQGADRVLGQVGFTTNVVGTTITNLNFPFGATVDLAGDVWVADTFNNRVLKYDCPCSDGQAAVLVLGQPGFTTNTQNNGGISATSLNFPRNVEVEADGDVWVADSGNHRVLKYNAPTSNGEAADLVLGQTLFTTGASGTTASTLFTPGGVAVEADGDVWVADLGNNRVLKYNAPTSNGEAADLVLGQPDFTTGGFISPTATSLRNPANVAVDMAGSLWVADDGNHRVLKFNNPTAVTGEAADLVLGQVDFTLNATPFPPTATSLTSPRDVAVEADGDVWVADSNNHRVLKYNNPTAATGEAADLVLGQATFTTSDSPNPPTATSLSTPWSVTVDSTGSVWVTDQGNNRVLRYGATTFASQAQGQVNVLGTCGLNIVSGSPINYGSLAPGATSLEQTLVLDDTGNTDATLFVKGSHWLDGTLTNKMNVDNTRFSTTSGTYASKTPLALTDQSIGTITAAANLSTFWQLSVNLLDTLFSGSLTQTIDLTTSC